MTTTHKFHLQLLDMIAPDDPHGRLAKMNPQQRAAAAAAMAAKGVPTKSAAVEAFLENYVEQSTHTPTPPPAAENKKSMNSEEYKAYQEENRNWALYTTGGNGAVMPKFPKKPGLTPQEKLALANAALEKKEKEQEQEAIKRRLAAEAAERAAKAP